MTRAPNCEPPSWRRRVGVGLALAACVAGLAWASLSSAQSAPTPAPMAIKAPVEHGVHWKNLKPAQQASLRPLEHEWAGISASQKQEWLKLSGRFPKMTPAEQTRVQDRMAEWARMTPQQRGQARLNFQEAKQITAKDRQSRWDAYQALTPEQRQRLAAHAEPAPSAASSSEAARRRSQAGVHAGKSTREAPQAKSNIVPNPAFAAPLRAISPTIVQARPGATTTLITRRPAPPSHQHTGLPKIAATPGFVNKATLLPERGPQGAATRSVAASAPGTSPSR